jgi:hypothetical protein
MSEGPSGCRARVARAGSGAAATRGHGRAEPGRAGHRRWPGRACPAITRPSLAAGPARGEHIPGVGTPPGAVVRRVIDLRICVTDLCGWERRWQNGGKRRRPGPTRRCRKQGRKGATPAGGESGGRRTVRLRGGRAGTVTHESLRAVSPSCQSVMPNPIRFTAPPPMLPDGRGPRRGPGQNWPGISLGLVTSVRRRQYRVLPVWRGMPPADRSRSGAIPGRLPSAVNPARAPRYIARPKPEFRSGRVAAPLRSPRGGPGRGPRLRSALGGADQPSRWSRSNRASSATAPGLDSGWLPFPHFGD